MSNLDVACSGPPRKYTKNPMIKNFLKIAFFMFFAILMHIKVNDPLYKSLPAGIFLTLTVLIALFVEN